MTYRVRHHPNVADDLEAIFRLIADYSGFEIAYDKLNAIEARLLGLAATPHVGSLRDEILPGLRAIPAARKAVIAFQVDDAASEVYVLCVVYAGADWIGRSAARER